MASSGESLAAVSAETRALLGTPVVRLEALDGRAWVLRATLADGRTRIVKRLRPEGYGLRSAAELMRCERAALELIGGEPGLAGCAPRLLAASSDGRMLVLEDLGPRVALSELLRRDGLTPELDDRLTGFATAAGTLAAASVGRGEWFAARRTALGSPPRALRDGEHAWTGAWRTTAERVAGFGVPMPTAAVRDLRLAGAELAGPGPFLALTNGDPEAHNYLTPPDGGGQGRGTSGEGGGRLVDFEGAGFRHALTAAAVFCVPGPHWMAVSGPRQLAAFRSALARAVPEARDDGRFGFGLASAAMIWVAVRAGEVGRWDARRPGDASRAQLVLLLEAGARTAETYGVLPDLAGWCRSTAVELRRRWPDADVDTGNVRPYTWRERS